VGIACIRARRIPRPESAGISGPFRRWPVPSDTSARFSFSSDKAEMKPRAKGRRWSGEVTRRSNALDLEANVFKQRSPHGIALSLKRSAEASTRRKARPYQSAMSMLNFYINRAGANLSREQKAVLVRAKSELRKVFHRE